MLRIQEVISPDQTEYSSRTDKYMKKLSSDSSFLNMSQLPAVCPVKCIHNIYFYLMAYRTRD